MLEESAICKTVIDHSAVMAHYNPGSATKLSRDLYLLLMHKTSDQAKNQLKSLGPDQGLEGWRFIQLNLSQRDGQRLEAESDALTHLVKLKISDMPKWITLLVR